MRSENKIKYTAALIVAVIVVGAILIAPSALAKKDSVESNEDKSYRWYPRPGWLRHPLKMWIELDEDELDEDELIHWRRFPKPIWLRYPLKLWTYVFENGVPETVEGEAVTLHGHILVVRIDDNDVNVVVPRMWIVEDEIMAIEELFDEEGPFVFGNELTIYTLKIERSESTHVVTAYFAYKMSGGGETANALLPFNIKVTTESS